MKNDEFKAGDKVTFQAGRAKTKYTAEVVGVDGQFYLTKDADGNERKARKGSCQAA